MSLARGLQVLLEEVQEEEEREGEVKERGFYPVHDHDVASAHARNLQVKAAMEESAAAWQAVPLAGKLPTPLGE